MSIFKMNERKKPYTEIGIRRLPCARCGKRPSVHQWQCCANDGKYMPLCDDCDIKLNWLALEFMGHPRRKNLIRRYSERFQRHDP